MKELVARIKEFFIQCGRVWNLTRKPSKEEIKLTSKVSAIGLLIIGVIGFVIGLIIEFLLKLK
ncbi:MAG: protein translocase SEC61 complex subunit gamma [Candidatus Pacearchaeota archaeon]